MSSSIIAMLKNPFSLWIKWVVTKIYYEHKYAEKNLEIGYMARFTNCRFGNYNTLHDDAMLTNVTLGDFSYVAANSKLANVFVGKFSCIGPEVFAGMGKHPSRGFISTHPFFYSPHYQAQITLATNSIFEEFEPIKIGNDVWVGARAIILDGVSIGDGAIVGAGAVVTKNVPPYAVVGGVPAKVIRYRFEQADIDLLEQLKWWDRDIDWLRKNCELMREANLHTLTQGIRVS